MVKYLSILFAVASIAASVFASPIEQRDISNVKVDLQAVSRAVVMLDTAVSNIGLNIDMAYALRINADVQVVQSRIAQSTKDVKEIHSVSEGDAKAILTQIKGFLPTILHLLSNIDAKKSVFAALATNVIPLIGHELRVLHDAASDLSVSMISIAPNDVKGDAMDLQKVVDAAFSKVIARYT